MIHPNEPQQTPDWFPNAGNLCGTCLGTANLCRVLIDVDDQPCCGTCTHSGVREPAFGKDRTMNDDYPRTWEGDQA